MPLRLMCITAHPDDEAGAFGGALLMSAAEGVQTSVLCLTAGAAGSFREPGQSDAELAQVRREEFARANHALGVGDGVLLDYPDGGLASVPFWPLVGTLLAHVRRVRPHVVLTFGADGQVNLHPDHTTVSLAATAAFHWAGRRELPPEVAGAGSELPAPWSPQKLFWASTQFVSVRDQELADRATLTPGSLRLVLGAWEEKKYHAFQQHSSQRAVLERVRAQFAEQMRTESYLLVAARPGQGSASLFAGVQEE